jgi:hypothetical protein
MTLDPKIHPEEGREFAIRYYRWALDQWPDEIEHGFPMFRGIGGEESATELRILRRLEPQDRLALGRALVKWHHSDAVAFLGERLSQSEERQVQWHNQERMAVGRRYILSGGLTSGGPWAPVMTHDRPPQARRALLKEVRRAVEPILGPAFYHPEPSDWRYRTRVGRWAVVTFIRFGLTYDLSYCHDIRFGDESDSMCRRLSAGEWMGLTSSDTGWVLSSPDDIPGAAAALASFCRRFLEAAPELLPE